MRLQPVIVVLFTEQISFSAEIAIRLVSCSAPPHSKIEIIASLAELMASGDVPTRIKGLLSSFIG